MPNLKEMKHRLNAIALRLILWRYTRADQAYIRGMIREVLDTFP